MKRILLIVWLSFCFSQDKTIVGGDIPNLNIKKYFTDEDGNIKMLVNVWGHVVRPGTMEVHDGIDIITLISLAGGPRIGVDYDEILIYREPKNNGFDGLIKYNLNNFLKNGDRNNLLKIRPNDTIVISQKASYFLFENLASINVIFSILNLYFQIQQR